MKDIPGYEGLYAVTTDGRVWSYPKHWHKRSHSGKWLSASITKGGYAKVSLRKQKNAKHYLVHRLVALTYIDKPDGKPAINHKDGEKLNNCVDNLEWCTWKENDDHARSTGLKNPVVGVAVASSKLTESIVRSIKERFAKGDTQASLAKRYGVTRQTVHAIVHNKTWKEVA